MRLATVATAVMAMLCVLAAAASAQRASVPAISQLVDSASEIGEAPPAPAAESDCADADARAGKVSKKRLADALTCLIAEERDKRRLADVERSSALRRSASAHAHDMHEHGFFSHRSSDGRSVADRAKAAGYVRSARTWEVAEALHWGQGSRSTPRRALAGLLSSPPHRAILLSRRLRDIGVAAFTRGTVGTYVVNMGRRS